MAETNALNYWPSRGLITVATPLSPQSNSSPLERLAGEAVFYSLVPSQSPPLPGLRWL
jgi:hypothetical protein